MHWMRRCSSRPGIATKKQTKRKTKKKRERDGKDNDMDGVGARRRQDPWYHCRNSRPTFRRHDTLFNRFHFCGFSFCSPHHHLPSLPHQHGPPVRWSHSADLDLMSVRADRWGSRRVTDEKESRGGDTTVAAATQPSRWEGGPTTVVSVVETGPSR